MDGKTWKYKQTANQSSPQLVYCNGCSKYGWHKWKWTTRL